MNINPTPAEAIAAKLAEDLKSVALLIKSDLDYELKRDTDGDVLTSPLHWTGNVKVTTNHWTNIAGDEGQGPTVWFQFHDPRTETMWISPEIRDGYHVSVFEGDI